VIFLAAEALVKTTFKNFKARGEKPFYAIPCNLFNFILKELLVQPLTK